ncbi:MAG: hypothetical protein AAGN35_03145 [Bacteroidota bacterium]
MTPKLDLYELIHALNDGEVKTFRKEILKRRGKHTYLKVFDAIRAQEIYDEAALKEQFAGEKTLNNFSIAKKNLYEKLLDVLCQLPYHQTIETQFDRFRQQIAILIKKSLYKQAMDRVRKAIKVAEKLEAFKKVLDLHDLQREIARNYLPPDNYLSLLNELKHRDTYLRELEDNISQYKNIFNTASIAQKIPQPIRRTMLNGILAHTLMQDESECRSVSARLYFYRIWNHVYYVQGRDSGWKFFTERIISLLEKHQPLLSDPGKFLVYVNTISDYGLNCIASNEFAVALETAEKLQNIRKDIRAGDNEAMIFNRYWKLQLLYCQKLLDEKNGMGAVEKIRDGLRRFRGKVAKGDAMELIHLSAGFLLTMERSAEAIQPIMELREDRGTQVRPDLHFFSWLLFFVAHYNLGNFDVIEQQLPGAIHHFKQRRRYSAFFKICLTLFRKSVLARNKNEMMQRLKIAREALMDLFRSTNDQGPLRYFHLIAWIDSRLNDVPLYNQMRKTPEKLLLNESLVEGERPTETA